MLSLFTNYLIWKLSWSSHINTCPELPRHINAFRRLAWVNSIIGYLIYGFSPQFASVKKKRRFAFFNYKLHVETFFFIFSKNSNTEMFKSTDSKSKALWIQSCMLALQIFEMVFQLMWEIAIWRKWRCKRRQIEYDDPLEVKWALYRIIEGFCTYGNCLRKIWGRLIECKDELW